MKENKLAELSMEFAVDIINLVMGSCTGWYDFYAGRDCGINIFPRTVF